jgi:predicted ATPase
VDPDCDRFFVLTGGPGSGKSTLIERLLGRGYAGSEETRRAIIRDQVRIGGQALPWRDPKAYAELMLGWEMRSHRVARDRPGTVFFDRGVPDVIGYLRLQDLPVPAYMAKAAELFRYNRRVLIAPPWPEIYEQDTERKQDLEEAERTYLAMQKTYAEFGYVLIELPRVSVEERLRFALETLRLPGIAADACQLRPVGRLPWFKAGSCAPWHQRGGGGRGAGKDRDRGR